MAKISHVLPPLSDSVQIQQLDSAGKWEAIENNSLLINIARGLRVMSQQENEKYLVSVPDVWARTDIVKTALFDKEHRLHYKVTKEWRGFLAIVALSSYHGYTLTTELINLTELEKNPYEASSNTVSPENNANLGSVINDLIPKTLLSSQQSWGEIALLRCNGDPIGLIVPSTIFCPSRNVGSVLNKLVPWCSNNEVNDPCKIINVQVDEFASLKMFLESLLAKVKEESTEISTANGISGALTDFIRDVDEKFTSLSGPQSGILARLSPSPTNFSLPQQPIYSCLSNIFAIDYGDEEHFDTVIPSRSEYNKNFKGAVFVDHNMANTTDQHPARIKIWGNHSLQTYLDSTQYHDQISSNVEEKGYILLDPSNFFTKQLCAIEGELYFSSQTGNKKSFILPIDPKILLLYSAEEINKRVEISKTGKGYKVTFKVTLNRSDGTEWTHLVEKDYESKNVIKRSMPDSLSQWPNFSHESWSWYYFFFAGNLPIHFSPRGLFSSKEIIGLLSKAPDQISRVKIIKNLTDHTAGLGRRLGLIETQVLYEMYLLESSPEAMICDAQTNNEITGYVPSKERQVLGILLFPEPPKIQTSGRNATIGIDFGTTNTSAYVKIQEDKSYPINFKDRIISPIIGTESDTELGSILRAFFPHNEVGVPFLTILRDRDLPQNATDVFPAWNSHLYYVNDIVSSLSELISDKKRDLRFNLKWSRLPSDRNLVRQYMAQVVMQCLAELVSSGIKPENVDWKFSYPEAYPPSQLEDFIAICSSATKMALSPDPSAITFTPKIGRQSESLSTALYFIEEKSAYMVQNAITIDIGGQTSDISIWQSRNLVWRNSLEVAGRHIFIDYIKQNINLIESLASHNTSLAEGLKQLKELGADDLERFGYGIEILVNSEAFSTTFNRDFELIGGVNEGALLKQLSLIALGGILHYTGMTMRHLYETGVLEKGSNRHLSICLGGRGSLIYKAIFKDGVEDVREREGILKLFCDAIGDGIETAEFIFSSHHKHEVAYGLLVDTTGARDLDLKSKRSSDVLIGENFMIGKEVITKDMLVGNLPTKGEWKIDDVTSIKVLIEKLSKHLGINIDIEADKQAKNDLIGRISSQLIDTQNRMTKESGIAETITDTGITSESEVIEPVFVIVLRSLLEQISARRIDVKYLTQ